jgi:ABC-type lipoprotein export system ATPase subunit
MKVSRIEIKDFQQFKDFELDLTYPEGHPKAGQPLDKVCFIGQSGTGKTTILRVIKDFLDLQTNYSEGYRYRAISKDLALFKNLLNPIYCIDLVLNGQIEKIRKNKILLDMQSVKASFLHKTFFYTTEEQYLYANPHDLKKLLYVYLNAELIEKSNQMLKHNYINTKLIFSNQEEELTFINEEKKLLKNKLYFDFNEDNPQDVWKIILYSAQTYIIEYVKNTKALLQLFLSEPNEAQSRVRQLGDWQKDLYNPFMTLANKLDLLLGQFNLKMKQNIDFENQEEIQFVLVQQKNDYRSKFDYKNLSTGTKQVLMTATPLFALDTKDSIILFDEPERSLFPDIQRTLIKYYTDLAPEAQFFFATHSPIIASQFEPCERFILSFDEETGFVKAHNGFAPEGDDPNDLLSKDFGMRNLMGEKGLAAWERFIELRMLIREEKNDTKKEQFANEYLSLQRAYNF